MRLRLAQGRQRGVDRPVAGAADEQFLGGEAGDHLAAVGGDDDLLLDARCRPAVGRRPVGLQGEDHPLLENLGVVERDHPAEDRSFPDRQPDAVAVLQRERGHLVGEAELGGRRPHGADVGGRHAGLDHGDRPVDVLAADLVGVALRRRGAAHLERAVVARAVAVVAVQDVEERRVTGTDDAVGVDVRVRRAALAGDRVDALDVLRPEVEQRLGDEADALVLAHTRSQRPVQLLVGSVDHRAGMGEQEDLVGRLDPPGLEEHLLAVDHGQASRRARRRAPASRRGRRRAARWSGRARRERRGPWRRRRRRARHPEGSRRAASTARAANRGRRGVTHRATRRGRDRGRATGCTAGGDGPPNRSPRRSDRRRGG